MIACIRADALTFTRQRPEGILALLSDFTPNVEAEGPLELRADARRRHVPYSLPASQLDEQPAATYYADLGKLTVEEALTAAHNIHHRVATHFHVSTALGLAGGKFTARLAAASLAPNEVSIVRHGEETRFLAGFPVSVLPVDGETLRQLRLLGLQTLGQLAALPASALLGRFGKQGQLMHRLASGYDTSRVAPYTAPVVLTAQQTFDWAVDQRPTLLHSLRRLAAELSLRLEREHQTASQITLSLTLEGGGAIERTVALREPTARRTHVISTLEEIVQSISIPRGIIAMQLELGGIQQPVSRQLSLFDRSPVSQSRLREVLKDLTTRYGDCFYWAVLLDADENLAERRYSFKKVEVE